MNRFQILAITAAKGTLNLRHSYEAEQLSQLGPSGYSKLLLTNPFFSLQRTNVSSSDDKTLIYNSKKVYTKVIHSYDVSATTILSNISTSQPLFLDPAPSTVLMVAHSAPNAIDVKDEEFIPGSVLRSALQRRAAISGQLFVYLDTCYGATLLRGLYFKGVSYFSSSGSTESSYGTDINLTWGASLNHFFTKSFLKHVAIGKDSLTLEKVWNLVKTADSRSNAEAWVYNSNLSQRKISEFLCWEPEFGY